MSKLIYSPKLEVKISSIHGYGVFASEDIKNGEVLEECHFMSIPDVKYKIDQFNINEKTPNFYTLTFYK